MNYKSIYWSIILNRLDYPYIGYTEKHHILPLSLGGDSTEVNLVSLSAKEHYICHHLLTKMYLRGSTEYYKMVSAFILMLSTRTNKKVTARGFSILREDFSKLHSLNQTGILNSQYGTKWICNREELIERKIPKDTGLLDGWEFGRLCLPTKLQLEKENILKDKLNLKKVRTSTNIIKYSEWYKIYKEYGFDKFKEITGYDKSKPNLVQQFAKYVKEFIPQNGKQRGI